VNRSILAVLVLCTLSCTAPDDDSSAGNSAAQNPPPESPAGNSETQASAPDTLVGGNEAQTPSDVPAGDSATQNPPVDALQYYLGLKKLSINQMYMGQDGALVNRERRQSTDESGEPVSVVHSIKLIASGINKDRQAFLVQESYTQPDAAFPEHDRYMCTLLVFISRGGGWVLENNDMFNESDDAGVTRRQEPCDGFELTWENGFPVLSGADGKVRLRDGKYVLDGLETGL
jgi:hypothetical protein